MSESLRNRRLEVRALWLADKLLQHAAQEVMYQRGAESITLQATVGRREVLVETSVGIVERHEQWEFILRASDLAFSGITVEPARGDRIKHVRAGMTHVYEVMPLVGEDAFRLEHSGPNTALLKATMCCESHAHLATTFDPNRTTSPQQNAEPGQLACNSQPIAAHYNLVDFSPVFAIAHSGN